METTVCPQCNKPLVNSAHRLVQDSCGHKKCRVCLLEDEHGCKMCISKPANNSHENITPMELCESDREKCDIPCVPNSNNQFEIKQKQVKTEPNVTAKRTYVTCIVPSHITVTDSLYTCKICGRSFTSKGNIKYHKYCVTGKKPYQCKTCSKDFIALSHLEMHELIHADKKPFSCETCGKSFRQRSKLNRHVALHSDMKGFVCQECGKAFKSKESLGNHSRLHSNEKPFVCDICNAKFSNSSNYKKHLASHSSEKPNMCDLCGKRFKLKWTLTTHRKTHTSMRPFPCSECPKIFTYLKDLQRHKLIHLDSKTYSCGVCLIKFRRKDNLERHMRNIHPGSKEPPIINIPKPENNDNVTIKPVLMDQPNAINVITAPPMTHLQHNAIVATTLDKNENRSVINAPLKLAFKTNAFKTHYNIHRNYVAPEPDTTPRNDITVENPARVIKSEDLPQKLFPSPAVHYETSFDQEKHAIIKNIKFKLPAKYTNFRSGTTMATETFNVPSNVCQKFTEETTNFLDLSGNNSVANGTSVIVNSPFSSENLHWRRRTSQNLNAKLSS